MRKLLIIFFCILQFSNVFASHISGGEMIYEYLGPGTTANTSKYRITLKLFRDDLCSNCAGMPLSVFIGIFLPGANIPGSPFSVTRTSISPVSVEPPPVCMDDPPILNYAVGTYSFIVSLNDNAKDYTVSYQGCCRINPLGNVSFSPPAQGVGFTYMCVIPGTDKLPTGHNSSPQFNTQLAPVCYNSPFSLNFSAVDPDGDSLVYFFSAAYNGLIGALPVNPPYPSVNYDNGYSASNPLGLRAQLNPQSGIISGISPSTINNYVVCVCILEYRNGILIAFHRKDFILPVRNCSIPHAELNPNMINCDDLNVTFLNNTATPSIRSYYWDFGDGNTSTEESPTHPYADSGIYNIKLVVNRDLPCSDSTTSILKLYPGFNPLYERLGKCFGTPLQFKDKTYVRYGNIVKWEWNFSDPASGPNNTSSLQNPTHIFAAPGNYNTIMRVETSKGCVGTFASSDNVTDKPEFTVLPKDTLICAIDTLQIAVNGAGSVLWSPNYMISDVNALMPLVSPDVTTNYTARFTDNFGCVGSDMVKVNVKLFVTQFAGSDSTICQNDAVLLQLTSDALHFIWTENPAGNTLNNPALKNPVAKPLVQTTYHVTGNIGKCIAENDITITPIPYPLANAGIDQTICFGNSAQLNASGGSIYSWSPEVFLTDRYISNPQSILPTDNVRYIVTVRDVKGCPKPVKDTMILYVTKIKAEAGPRDTAVVIDQPLQLNATGSTNYFWTPATWLNNSNISNPIALPRNDIDYIVKVSDNLGCFNYDSIHIRVFKLKPDLYVPNAFTPNDDTKNDYLNAIPLGMKSFDIFRVYNRLGQLLYSGNGNSFGWDGRFAGNKQEAGTYIWYAEGIDYLNNKLKRRGSVILIR